MTQLLKPQRLPRPAQPGELFKRITERIVKPREDNDRDPKYLELIRQLPCLCCGMIPSQAAHVRLQSAAHNKTGGMQRKPADRWVLPLCGGPYGCHAIQHKLGEQQFWYDIGLSPLRVCELLYRKRYDLVAMEAVVIQAIANRGGTMALSIIEAQSRK